MAVHLRSRELGNGRGRGRRGGAWGRWLLSQYVNEDEEPLTMQALHVVANRCTSALWWCTYQDAVKVTVMTVITQLQPSSNTSRYMSCLGSKPAAAEVVRPKQRKNTSNTIFYFRLQIHTLSIKQTKLLKSQAEAS